MNELAAQEERQYLSFASRSETYAIAIHSIREIIEYAEMTSMPSMPASIRGVINLRGKVVPVVDLGARFGKGITEAGKRSCIVIVEAENRVVGVMVDAVNEVIDIPSAEMEPAPSFGAKIRADFIHGMGKVAGKFVIVLNAGKVLAVDDLAEAA